MEEVCPALEDHSGDDDCPPLITVLNIEAEVETDTVLNCDTGVETGVVLSDIVLVAAYEHTILTRSENPNSTSKQRTHGA